MTDYFKFQLKDNEVTTANGFKNEVNDLNALYGIAASPSLLWGYNDNDVYVNLSVRTNPTKQENQRAKLVRYFIECVSEPLLLNSA